jgi:hypothetical protein
MYRLSVHSEDIEQLSVDGGQRHEFARDDDAGLRDNFTITRYFELDTAVARTAPFRLGLLWNFTRNTLLITGRRLSGSVSFGVAGTWLDGNYLGGGKLGTSLRIDRR